MVGIFGDNDAEVEIILEDNNALCLIEVKMASNLNGHDASGIRAFRETYKNCSQQIMPGVIIFK